MGVSGHVDSFVETGVVRIDLSQPRAVTVGRRFIARQTR
jgi:hypothetical protein